MQENLEMKIKEEATVPVIIRIWEGERTGHASLETEHIYASFYPDEVNKKVTANRSTKGIFHSYIDDIFEKLPSHVYRVYLTPTGVSLMEFAFINFMESAPSWKLSGKGDNTHRVLTGFGVMPSQQQIKFKLTDNCSGLVINLLSLGGYELLYNRLSKPFYKTHPLFKLCVIIIMAISLALVAYANSHDEEIIKKVGLGMIAILLPLMSLELLLSACLHFSNISSTKTPKMVIKLLEENRTERLIENAIPEDNRIEITPLDLNYSLALREEILRLRKFIVQNFSPESANALHGHSFFGPSPLSRNLAQLNFDDDPITFIRLLVKEIDTIGNYDINFMRAYDFGKKFFEHDFFKIKTTYYFLDMATTPYNSSVFINLIMTSILKNMEQATNERTHIIDLSSPKEICSSRLCVE
ncbi:MAG: hypothetical protein K2Q14_07085 [Gammaproteobacteria bacterium]|nr:hypothetical protein [Gammaproteobacteria bacterium]